MYDEQGRDGRGNAPIAEQLLINPNAKLQLTELDHTTPLFKISENANAAADPESVLFSNLSAIDGQIYQTSWSKLLGTELIFDDYGELVGTVREHLVSDPSTKVRSKVDEQKGEEADDAVSQGVDTRTAFLKRAIAAARLRAQA